MIMKGRASHRFTTVQLKNAETSEDSHRTAARPSFSIHWFSRPNWVLNIPVFHSRMPTYPGMAQGNMRMVLYSLRSRSFLMFKRFARAKAMTSCSAMLTKVQRTVASSADRKPESNTNSARA